MKLTKNITHRPTVRDIIRVADDLGWGVTAGRP